MSEPSPCLSQEQPSLPMELPESDRARKRRAWRVHTAQNWKEDDPESYAECVEHIRLGCVNQSELARRFAHEDGTERSRNSIQALMMEEFNETELLEITRKAAIIVRAQGVEKTGRLIDGQEDPDQVGGVAMATKLMSDIAQVMSDRPTSISEETVIFRVEDFNAEIEATSRRAREGKTYEATVIDEPVTKALRESPATRGSISQPVKEKQQA